MRGFDLKEVITEAYRHGASDIHLIKDQPLKVRIDGALKNMSVWILSDADCSETAKDILGPEYEKLIKNGEADIAGSVGEIRCRMNFFRQKGSISGAIRILGNTIPKLETLGMPPPVRDFPYMKRGLVLVSGITGSGKSTTLASIIDEINHTRNAHILTIEDPVEYIFTSDRCAVNQREIGTDTRDFSSALRAAMREDPDVILIGEMRDGETMDAALHAAETGHMVFATVHAKSAADCIDRIIGSFSPERQNQARIQLASVLNAVITQQLVRKKEGGRTAAVEVMMASDAVRANIRSGDTAKIRNAQTCGAAEGSVTMDKALIKLVNDKIISFQTALDAAYSPEYIRNCLAGSM